MRPARVVRLLAALAVPLAVPLAVLTWVPAAQAQRSAEPSRALRFPFPRDDGSLTPYTFERGYGLMTLVYDTLYWRDERGTPQPWLVRSLRRSDAGRRVTLRLQAGVRWHDGTPFTAADVAFSFAYFARRPHPRFTPQLRNVVRARATGRDTVLIALRHPSPGFLDQPLADMPILPRHLWSRLDPGRAAPPGLAVGTGPYRLVEHRRGRRYRLRANRGYFRGRPRVESIEVPFISDFDRTVRTLVRRKLDMIPASLPPDAAERLATPSFEIARGPSYTGVVLMFNLRRPPFDSARARLAVARAIDRRRVMRAATRTEGMAADRGYPHPMSGWATTAPLDSFDAEAAERELAALGLRGIRVIAPDNDPVRREAGRQVVLALERAGADATLEALPAPRVAAAVGEDGSSPDFDAAIWVSPALASYDPDFLVAVFGSDARLSPLNYSGYSSPRFDRLAERVESAVDPSARRRAVRQQLLQLERDAPVVPLFFQTAAFPYRPAIYDGWRFVEGTGILDKRSFLSRFGRRPLRAGTAVEPSDSGASGIGPVGWLAIALLAGALAAAAWALGAQRRRRRPTSR